MEIGDNQLTELFEKERLEKNEFFKIILQILCALYDLGKYKIIHNDLHPGNIVYIKSDKNFSHEFEIEGEKFKFDSKYKIKLIDWGLSNVDKIDSKFKNIFLINNDNNIKISNYYGSLITNRYTTRDILVIKILLNIGFKKKIYKMNEHIAKMDEASHHSAVETILFLSSRPVNGFPGHARLLTC